MGFSGFSSIVTVTFGGSIRDFVFFDLAFTWAVPIGTLCFWLYFYQVCCYYNHNILFPSMPHSRSLLVPYLLLLPCCLSFIVNIPSCPSTPQPPNLTPFTYTTTGTIDNTTSASMCHDDKYLHIRWYCQDDDIISTYTKCNDPLYNEDAVEVFLATNGSYPNRYFEFQVSPSGQLFFADINNPALTCSNLGTTYYPCTSATYSSKITSTGWQGYLKIDLEIIGRGRKYELYKGNLYRIDKSRTKATRYLAYNPALNSPACFHQPLKFVDFVLV